MSTPAEAAPVWTKPSMPARSGVALAIVLAGAVLVMVDASIVNVAIPVLREDLGASFSEAQLVVAVYQVAYAALLITGGRLGDLYGRKRLFLVGLGGFVAASVVCGLAPDPVTLVVARAFQGAAAALMLPQTLSVIQVVIPLERRPRALAAFGVTSAAATILGPLLSGVIIHADVLGSSWRPSFLINLPVGLIGLVLAVRFLPESRSEQAKRLDLGGALLITLALSAVIVALIEGTDLGWPIWTVVLIVGSVPLFWRFARRCRVVHARNGSALVPPALWKDRAFVIGLVIYVLAYACVLPFFLYQSITLQYGQGYSALQTGLTSTPYAIGTIIGYRSALRAQRRLDGRAICLTGSALWTVGTIGLLITVLATGTNLSGLSLLPMLVVAGFGAGFMIGPLLGTILGVVSSFDAGAASGLLTTGQQVGGALGIAAAGLVFLQPLNGTVLAATPGQYIHAFAAALMVMVAVLVVNTVLISLLPRDTRKGSTDPAAR